MESRPTSSEVEIEGDDDVIIIDEFYDCDGDLVATETEQDKEDSMLKKWDNLVMKFEKKPSGSSLSPMSFRRIRNDIRTLIKEPVEGIYVSPDGDDITKVNALLVGPEGTPYHGGFFLFKVRFTPEYPFKPPAVTIATTDSGKVRFNPNLYACGKVCLSIINTWPGPQWSAAQNLGSVLISIRSLMNDKPYTNEPGFSKASTKKIDSYNEFVQHETLRVAVCGNVERLESIPEGLQEPMRSHYRGYSEFYRKTAKERIRLQGKSMDDGYGASHSRKFDYKSIGTRLSALDSELSGTELAGPSGSGEASGSTGKPSGVKRGLPAPPPASGKKRKPSVSLL